jgi:hypothetical protein
MNSIDAVKYLGLPGLVGAGLGFLFGRTGASAGIGVAAGVAVGGGAYLVRNRQLQTQVTTLNAKCAADRALAQEASTATPERRAAIRAQVEAANGTAFLSEFEWNSWVTSQSISTCSAFVQ